MNTQKTDKADTLAEHRDCDMVQVDGLDDAILGVVDMADASYIAYSYEKCIQHHIDNDGMDYWEAREWVDDQYPVEIVMVYDHYIS